MGVPVFYYRLLCSRHNNWVTGSTSPSYPLDRICCGCEVGGSVKLVTLYISLQLEKSFPETFGCFALPLIACTCRNILEINANFECGIIMPYKAGHKIHLSTITSKTGWIVSLAACTVMCHLPRRLHWHLPPSMVCAKPCYPYQILKYLFNCIACPLSQLYFHSFYQTTQRSIKPSQHVQVLH